MTQTYLKMFKRQNVLQLKSERFSILYSCVKLNGNERHESLRYVVTWQCSLSLIGWIKKFLIKLIKYWIDDSEDDYDTMIIKQVLS